MSLTGCVSLPHRLRRLRPTPGQRRRRCREGALRVSHGTGPCFRGARSPVGLHRPDSACARAIQARQALTKLPLPPPQHLQHGGDERVVDSAPRDVHNELEADNNVCNL